MKRMLFTCLALLVFGAGAAGAAIINLNPGDSIQTAINDADPFDELVLADGTYVQTAQINVNKAISITGASEAGVIIDASAVAGYVFSVSASDVAMEYMTILPADQNYTIHASGATILPSGLDNLTLRYITVEGAHRRSAFDIHGYNNVIASHLTARDAYGGVGLALTGVVGATVDNIISSNNLWGSIAIYCSNAGYLNRACDSIAIDGNTLNLDDNTLMIQDEFGLTSTNVTVAGYEYIVRNLAFRPDAAGYYFFQETAADAIAYATLNPAFAGFEGDSFIYAIATGDFLVGPGMGIQPAIDAATPGDAINVDPGTYAGGLTVDKWLTLNGAGSGDNPALDTIIEATNVTGPAILITASGNSALEPTTFADFRVSVAHAYGFTVGVDVNDTVDLSYFLMDNVFVVGSDAFDDTETEIGLHLNRGASLRNLTVVDCAFDNLHYGWYTKMNPDQAGWGIPSNFQNVDVSGTSFSHCLVKGMYIEKLDQATFTSCVINDNGRNTAFWNARWNGGVDLNLKGLDYSGLAFIGCSFTSNGLDCRDGAGLMLKARDDGASYGAFPATLDDVLVQDCQFTGNERGIRLGEPGKLNLTPTNVVVEGCTIMGNVGIYAGGDGTEYGGLIMQSVPDCAAGLNWWGDIDPTDQVAQAAGAGTPLISPWLGAAPGTTPMTWYVNTTGTIQAAIDAAAAGDAIIVAAGHYEEQLHVNKDYLSITGAGIGATYVEAPDNMPLFFTTSLDNYPVIFVDQVSGIALADLTIDGMGRGVTNYRFQGLSYYNASGSATNLDILRIRNEPLNGSQHGNGVYCFIDDTIERHLTFTDVTVSDIQKTGAVFWGEGLVLDATRLTCIGSGPLGVGLPAQNGIQVGGGAAGVGTDCLMSDFDYTDPAWTATAYLLYGPGIFDLNGCTAASSKTSFYFIDASTTMDGCTVTDPVSDPLYAYSSGAKARLRAEPQPFDGGGKGDNKAPIVVNILNSVFTGNDLVDSWGPTAWASGPVEFNVHGCTIQNFDNGLNIYEDGSVVTGSASGNNLVDNLTFGAWSNSAVPYDARGNWWGDPTGPLHPTLNPGGLGNEVSDNILFEPWLGPAAAGIDPAVIGPVDCATPFTLTFQLVTDANTPPIFGFNAVVSATAELEFVDPLTGGIASLDPFGGPGASESFLFYNGGVNIWNVNGATIGGAPVPINTPGTHGLFTVDFNTLSDGDAVVAIDSIILRDENNAPIPATISGGSVITIDCTAPLPVTDLTADPGHEKVEVAWSHDGSDTGVFEVYRGLWYDTTVGTSAYPEYDDNDFDVIPTRPVDRADAVASTEWELAGTVPVGTNAFVDNAMISGRGVYYYEVFQVDLVGHTAPPAAANDRATNYWLGDVWGDNPGDMTPNGEVDAFDMTQLGTYFGLPVPHDDPSNVLDVGPTDDWSRVGIPLTDSVINFEDLMVFSMNFGVVTPAKDGVVISKSVELAWVRYDDGRMALRLVDGNGVKGLNVRADVAVSAVSAGELLDAQEELTFLRNVGETLDVSVAVLGVDNGFSGAGDLFIVEAGSEIAIEDLSIKARGADNSVLEFTLDETSGTLTPRVFSLNAAYPNPFNPMTKISFSLPEAQSVKLVVYGVDGRKVATLLDETRGAGLHEVVWTGRDEAGQSVATGVYFYSINAGPYSQVRKMTLMK